MSLNLNNTYLKIIILIMNFLFSKLYLFLHIDEFCLHQIDKISNITIVQFNIKAFFLVGLIKCLYDIYNFNFVHKK